MVSEGMRPGSFESMNPLGQRARATGERDRRHWSGLSVSDEKQNISGRNKTWDPIWQHLLCPGMGRGRGDSDLGKYEVTLSPHRNTLVTKMRGGAGGSGGSLGPRDQAGAAWECGCCSSEALIWGQG